MDPMEHYLLQGYKEARSPSARFDVRFYTRRYLREAPAENPLLHYLQQSRRLQASTSACRRANAAFPREVRRNTVCRARRSRRCGRCRRPPRAAPWCWPTTCRSFTRSRRTRAWWGPGFTEWTNLGRALAALSPAITSRAFPRDLGHYRLEGTDTLRRQVELARGAGFAGFVFYFYWFDGHRLLDKPLEAFLADRGVDFPFCLMWANENWTRRWDGSDDEVLISQRYRGADEPALIATFARHFAIPATSACRAGRC